MSYYAEIQLAKITADPNQPRKIFDEIRLAELAQSIAAIGVKQAIAVRKIGEDNFMIIAGERRYRASTIAEKETIPCVVFDVAEELTEEAVYSHQLNENLHREDLNPVEKAEFIQARIDVLLNAGIENPRSFVMSELGVNKVWLSKALLPLRLNEELRKLAQTGKVKDYATLKRLEGLQDEKRQEAMEQINSGEFNAKEFFSNKPKPAKAAVNKDQEEVAEAEAVEPVKKEPAVRLELTISEFKKLINATAFKHNLEALTDEEQSALLGKKRKELVSQFKEWFTTTKH